MLYSLVEMNRAANAPVRLAARAAKAWLSHPALQPDQPAVRQARAFADLLESTTRRYGKPDWRISGTEINGRHVPVAPVTVMQTGFCRLLRFHKSPRALAAARGADAPPQRPLLIFAPLSGHYATLLRGTVEGFLPHHDVYITDWTNARMAPVWSGRFDFADYVDDARRFIAAAGPGAHVLAVCQPGPPVLAAIALMAEDRDPALPASMTFMGSPIDARRSPTVPNQLAEERPFEWFEDTMIQTVPLPWPGAGRRVYPGFIQLSSFMHMNWSSHVDAHYSFFEHLNAGDEDSAAHHREFYDEYLSVLDLTEEFYLDTIAKVFQDHELARGVLSHRGRRVDPAAIETVPLLTVEGEKDDISGIGQTQAAHDLCRNLPDSLKQDYVQPGAGHYGVFNGSRFREQIRPRVSAFIAAHDQAASRPALRVVG